VCVFVYVYLIEKIYAIPLSTHVGQVDAAQGVRRRWVDWILEQERKFEQVSKTVIGLAGEVLSFESTASP